MDLNLLVGLDALLEHRSVQGAATALHLTPPAVSRILGRLRAATGDEILVRNGRSMVPTARALDLQRETHDLVTRARDILSPAQTLSLETLERAFVIRCHEALVAELSVGLIPRTAAEAPGIELRLVAETNVDDRDLSLGTVDIEVGNPLNPSPTIRAEIIRRDDMALVVRRGQALDVPSPTTAALTEAQHLAISRRGRSRGPLDEHLAQLGLTRRVVATVPTVAAAVAVIAVSNFVTVLPHRSSAALPDTVTMRPLPFRLAAQAALAVSWHRRDDADPAHAWMRGLIKVVLAGQTKNGSGHLRQGGRPGANADWPSERISDNRGAGQPVQEAGG